MFERIVATFTAESHRYCTYSVIHASNSTKKACSWPVVPLSHGLSTQSDKYCH